MATRQEYIDKYLEVKKRFPGAKIDVPEDIRNSTEFAPVRAQELISSLLKEAPGTSEARLRREDYTKQLFGSSQRIGQVAKVAGVEIPEEKPKFNPLAALSNILNIANPVAAVTRTLEGHGRTNFFNEYQKDIGGRLQSIRTGQFREEKTGKDLLAASGIISSKEAQEKLTDTKSPLKWLGTRAAGLAIDVLADPLTYVSFGAGTGLRVGGTALKRGGEVAFKRLVEKETEKTLANLAKKGVDLAAVKRVDRFDNVLTGIDAVREGTRVNLMKAAPTVGSRTEDLLPHLDAGGLKFFGQTVLPTETIRNAASTIALSKAGKVIGIDKLSNGLDAVKQLVGPLLSRDFHVPKEARAGVNRYYASRTMAMNDAKEAVTNALKQSGMKRSFNKEEQLSISRALDSRDFSELTDPTLRKTAELYAGLLDDVARKDIAAGVQAYVLENYLPLVYKAPRGRVQRIMSDFLRENPTRGRFHVQQLDPALARGKRLGSLRGAEQGRISDISLDEAIRLGLQPETDPTLLVMNRLMAGNMARAEKDFAVEARNLLKTKMLPDELETSIITVPKVREVNGRSVVTEKQLRVPKYVSDSIDNARKKLISDEPVQQLLRGFDRVQSFWKGSVTVIWPAFHVRNAIGNVAQNMLDMGLSALDPKLHSRAIRILIGDESVKIVDRAGKTWTQKEIKNAMEKNGVLSGNFMREEAEVVASAANSALGKVAQFTPLKVLRKVGTTIEDEAKVLSFIKNLERTGSVDEATKRVQRFLFDYSNLSPFEKGVMRRAIPFYTFGRKNLELQLKTLLTNPKAIAAEFKTIQAVTDKYEEGDREALPDFVQESLGIKFGEDQFGRPQFITGLGLPIEEAAARFKGVESAKQLVSSLSPMIRVPLELASGKDFFSGKDLKEITKAPGASVLPPEVRDALGIREEKRDVFVNGKKTGTATDYHWNWGALMAIRSLPTSRFASTLGMLTEEDKSSLSKIIRGASGMKFYSIDEEQTAFFKERERIDKAVDILLAKGVLKRDTAGRPYIVMNPETKQEIARIDDIMYKIPFKFRPSQLDVITLKAKQGDPVSKLILFDIMERPEIISDAMATETQFFTKKRVGHIPSPEAIQEAVAPTE